MLWMSHVFLEQIISCPLSSTGNSHSQRETLIRLNEDQPQSLWCHLWLVRPSAPNSEDQATWTTWQLIFKVSTIFIIYYSHHKYYEQCVQVMKMLLLLIGGHRLKWLHCKASLNQEIANLDSKMDSLWNLQSQKDIWESVESLQSSTNSKYWELSLTMK